MLAVQLQIDLRDVVGIGHVVVDRGARAAVLTRAPLSRAARAGLAAIAAFALAVLAWTAWGAHFDGYPASTHLVTAGKFIEYMLLAPAVALIVRPG